MKKTLALALLLALTAAFAACSQKTPTADAPKTENEPIAEAETTETEEPETEAEEAAEEEPAAELMSYDEFFAAAVDTPVTVETYVQAKQSWWDNKATVYTQNEEGAYFLFEMPCSEEDYAKLVPGTKIRVSGYKAEWSGEMELVDTTFEILEGEYIAEATDVTALLGTPDIYNEQNKFVAFKGMTVEAANDAGDAFMYKWDGSGQDGDDLYFNVSYNDTTYSFTVESYLTGPGTDVYEAVKALNVGDVIDMEGFLYWYEELNPHITSVTPVEG